MTSVRDPEFLCYFHLKLSLAIIYCIQFRFIEPHLLHICSITNKLRCSNKEHILQLFNEPVTAIFHNFVYLYATFSYLITGV